MKAIVILLAFALILSGCAQQNTANDADTNKMASQLIDGETQSTGNQGQNTNNTGVGDMKVAQGDTIKVEYVGTFPDTGEEFDKSEGRGPLEFVAGTGQMIKGFDEAVIGMKLNEEKTITVPPEKAYGNKGEGQTVSVPVAQIQADTNLAVGMTLYTSNGQAGTVTEIVDGNATIVFEHPLAGKTLQFWIKVVDIQRN